MIETAGYRTFFPIKVLLFRFGGVHFGVDADQVASTSVYRADDGADEPLWFHREAGYQTGPATTAPVVAILRGGDGSSSRMVIGDIEDIVVAEVEHVRPMPSLVEPYALRKGMWGVLLREGRVYILVDLNRLAGR